MDIQDEAELAALLAESSQSLITPELVDAVVVMSDYATLQLESLLDAGMAEAQATAIVGAWWISMLGQTTR